MANHRQFDPASGFVALPIGVMDLDMTPGAFRTLVELCRMANIDGYCWPSLEQLSTRLGRSRAALSGYVKELRALGLIDTLRQSTANGYNYRLKYLVTFWADWRKSMSRKPKSKAQKSERSVQPSERIEKTQNQSHINQTMVPDQKKPSPFVESVISKWNDLTKGMPFPGFAKPVPETLVAQSQDVLDGFQEAPLTAMQIRAQLIAVWASLRVECSAEVLALETRIFVDLEASATFFAAFEQELRQIWKPHWRKAPTNDQFKSLIQAAQARAPERAQRKLLQSYLKRLEISQSRLHHPCSSPSLAA